VNVKSELDQRAKELKTLVEQRDKLNEALGEKRKQLLADVVAVISYGSLTSRQNEIVALVACHLSNKEIADRLCITTKAVKAHLTKVYAQLGMTREQLRGRETL
jgi:DNA-binding NarL/FixJ family response regulator